MQAQQKFHHPAIPRAGRSGGRVIGKQLDNVFFIPCYCGKMPNTSNLREEGFALSHPWLKKVYHGAEGMVSGTAWGWDSGGRMRQLVSLCEQPSSEEREIKSLLRARSRYQPHDSPLKGLSLQIS